MLTVLSKLVLVASLVLNVVFLSQKFNQSQPTKYLVTRIVDGDTFVAGDKSIRLFGVDAPEQGRCGNKEAADELAKLILNKDVDLRDTASDRYGRTLANVYRGDDFVNLALLKTGWAVYKKEYSAGDQILAENSSLPKEQKLGVFSSLCTQLVNSANPKCTIKGIINAHDGDKTYHFPGCGGHEYETYPVELYHGDRWFCSEKEAEADGFAKSKNCFGKKF